MWIEAMPMEWFTNLLGTAGGAALVAGLFGAWQWKQNRKAQKEDNAANNKIADCTQRGREIKALTVAMRTVMYDKIKEKAKLYISRNWITVEEYEDLKNMHSVYHNDLCGNGFLDHLMKDVDRLEKRA